MTGDGSQWLVGLSAGCDAVLWMTAVLGLAWGLHLFLVAVNLRRRVASAVFGALVVAALGAFELVYAEADTDTDPARRTICFPADRSVGKLFVPRVEDSFWDTTHHQPVYWGNWGWDYIGEAKGKVTVPADAKLKLTLSAAGVNDLSWIADLGADDLYALSSAWTGRVTGTEFGDAQLEQLRPLTGLRELVLPETRISDKGLRAIEGFSSLELLRLRSPRIGNAGVAHVGKLTSLETLSLLGDRVSDKGLAHLTKLKSLKHLSLMIAKIRGPGMAHLARLPSLRYLWAGKPFGDAHLAHLKNSKSLRGLRIQGAEITNAGLAHVSGMTQLEYLDLWHTPVTDAGMVHLTPLRKLKRLNIRVPCPDPHHPPFTAKGMAQLAEMQSLEHLDLPNFAMTDECLAHVCKLENLEYLWIGCSTNSPITDAGLKHLAKLGRLERLFVGGTGITDEGMPHIAALSHLKGLLLASAPGVTNDGLAKLGALKSLQTLSLPSKSEVTLSGLNHLNALADLRYLKASGIEPPGYGEGPMDLSGLTRLEQLSLPPVRDQDLACLAGLERLKWLQMGSALNAISDAGMAYLRGLRSLERLSIGGDRITDKGLACLANLKTLNFIQIKGNFSDRGLRHLEGLGGLGLLRIDSGTWVSSAAIKRLRERLPNLTTFNVDRQRGSRTRTAKSARVGRPAPTFEVTTLDGKQIQLQDYRGKVVVLHFWATSSGPCLITMPTIKRSYERLSRHDDFVMISLSLDDQKRVSRLRGRVSRHDLTWPQVHLGPNSKIASRYGVAGVPRYVVVGRDGKILYNDNRLGPEFESVLRQRLEGKKGRSRTSSGNDS